MILTYLYKGTKAVYFMKMSFTPYWITDSVIMCIIQSILMFTKASGLQRLVNLLLQIKIQVFIQVDTILYLDYSPLSQYNQLGTLITFVQLHTKITGQFGQVQINMPVIKMVSYISPMAALRIESQILVVSLATYMLNKCPLLYIG